MFENIRTMFGRCSDDVRLFPVMSRCRVCPTPALRDEGGPTLGVRCAAGSVLDGTAGGT